jgi:hypothetical protein
MRHALEAHATSVAEVSDLGYNKLAAKIAAL